MTPADRAIYSPPDRLGGGHCLAEAWSDADLSDWLDAIQPDGGLVVVLTAYFDESGIHKGSKLVTVGGYVAHPHVWKHFSKHWRRHLAEARVSDFHATDLEALQGPYLGWDRSKRIGFQERLIETILHHQLAGIACGATALDYEEVIPAGSELREIYPSAYLFSAMHAVFRTVEWATAHQYHTPVAFVFEQGGPTPGLLIEQLTRWRVGDPRIGSVTFADSQLVVPLQAADMHAYEAWKHGENRFIDGIKRDERKSLFAMRHGDVSGYLVNREHLVDFVQEAVAYLAQLPESPPSAPE
jgi:hypothetical protein